MESRWSERSEVDADADADADAVMLMLSLLHRRDMRASEPFEPSQYASKRAIEPSRYASERAIEPSQSVVPLFKSEQIGCIAFK